MGDCSRDEVPLRYLVRQLVLVMVVVELFYLLPGSHEVSALHTGLVKIL